MTRLAQFPFVIQQEALLITWHRVRIGGDLTIAARGPLAPEEVALLETVGELLISRLPLITRRVTMLR